MRTKLYTFITLLFFCLSGCTELEIPPRNVIQDDDVFSSSGGVDIYMSRMYSELPIEDFRYSPARGFNHFWILQGPAANTGESLSRDQGSAMSESFGGYWTSAYELIREANYFLQTLPLYAENFSEEEVAHYLGEARFIRAFTYFALVKRYGGVPIIDEVLQYPDQPIEELAVPRASEEEVYDFIAEDLDFAFANMRGESQRGRANKYVAAAFKSRAMLFAGSIAKYNQTSLFDDNRNRLVGIPAERAVDYFKAAYEASLLVEGQYSLYKQSWIAGNEQAQFENYANLFFDASSPENILVKDYMYPETVHGYDAYNVPRQLMGGNGYSSEVSPTLNFVELFDGFPKNEDDEIKTMEGGEYVLYEDLMGIFSDVEPRLRGTVILPGDVFKGEVIEIWRGIYTGSVANGIEPLLPEGSTSPYPQSNIVSSANASQTPYTLPDGTTMNPAGASGTFTADATSSQTGFSIRKYLNPDMPASNVLENRSDQSWIELRYAEVLLNRAEAAYELYTFGETDADYLNDAFNSINLIRERAGAELLVDQNALTNVDVIREERRKELAFENKTWWDLKRWRIAHEEQNATLYRTLMPFYAAEAGKWFYDVRLDERNRRYTFDTRWYYQDIPQDAISTNRNLIQNPGY